MPITAAQAVEIARQHGLTLADATALQTMASTVDEARALVAQYVPSLPERVAAAEAAGDHAAAWQLKMQWQADLRARTNHNGFSRSDAPPTPPPPAPPAEPEPSHIDPASLVPGLGAGLGASPKPTLLERAAEAEAAGDWKLAMVLKSAELHQQHRRMDGAQPMYPPETGTE